MNVRPDAGQDEEWEKGDGGRAWREEGEKEQGKGGRGEKSDASELGPWVRDLLECAHRATSLVYGDFN